MTDQPTNDPIKRLRTILTDQEAEAPQPSPSHDEIAGRRPPTPKPGQLITSSLPPASPLQSPAPAAAPIAGTPSPGGKGKIGPAFWTVTGTLSLITNAVLIAILITLIRMLGAIQLTAGDAGAGIVGGLYDNFDKMKNAHIVANIPVVLQDVPVDFVLNYSTDTEVVLTTDVPIQANVAINAGIININGPANIVLQKGTRLPVHLDLQIPVQTTVDIDRQLPVDIPIASTELSTHFQGLQDTIKPIYCLLEPNALDLNGNLVCR
ncbi:MAG: hypothetical protein Fur0043_13640 [Anaerolineales bacterium]